MLTIRSWEESFNYDVLEVISNYCQYLEKLHIECWICMHEWDILPPNLKELSINDKGFIDSSLPKPLLTKYC